MFEAIKNISYQYCMSFKKEERKKIRLDKINKFISLMPHDIVSPNVGIFNEKICFYWQDLIAYLHIEFDFDQCIISGYKNCTLFETEQFRIENEIPESILEKMKFFV